MTGIFRQKNSANVLLLLLYALVLKFPMLLHPAAPVRQADDHYFYHWLLGFLDSLHPGNLFYALLAFILLFSQATLLNRIFNLQKMLPRPNYLAAMAYLLMSSLFREWSQFSAVLLINSLLIWAYYRMLLLYNSSKPGSAIFNIGLLLGIVSLLYQPAVIYVLLLLFAIFIMRPFQIRDWLIGLLGVTTPYYFLGIVLYLQDKWSWDRLIPRLSFSLPGMPESILITIAISLLLLPFMVGGFYVQNNLSKMLIQVRKNWSLLLLYLIISTVIILLNAGNAYGKWILCLVPLAGFHASAYFYPVRNTFPRILHWILFGFALYINYGPH